MRLTDELIMIRRSSPSSTGQEPSLVLLTGTVGTQGLPPHRWITDLLSGRSQGGRSAVLSAVIHDLHKRANHCTARVPCLVHFSLAKISVSQLRFATPWRRDFPRKPKSTPGLVFVLFHRVSKNDK